MISQYIQLDQNKQDQFRQISRGKEIQHEGAVETEIQIRGKGQLPAHIVKHCVKQFTSIIEAYKYLKYFTMKSQELEIDILKRQNREMAIKMQIYRVENQQLKAKNRELNQWVGNLSEVFSTVSASWQSITILEETLLNLMKKRTDVKDKTLLRKYQFHFKTFADIINNLSDKIKNPGHSDQATEDAKEQLRSFVKNYELIFKQFLETYFKFNQDYTQYLHDLKSREDVKEQVSRVLSKSFESTQKNKEFEAYFETLKQKFQMFEQFNNNKLLEGVVKLKEQEINTLKERNNVLQRRIKFLFDYNSQSVELQLEDKPEQFECRCGGVQLAYMKKAWEEKLKNSENGSKKQSQDHTAPKTESYSLLQTKLAQVEQQKNNLITRNSLLLQKISKMNTQSKLTDELILRSNIYAMLKEQCQYLMDYVTELLGKIRKQQEYLTMIERARDEELKEAKRRWEKDREKEKIREDGRNNNHSAPAFNSPGEIFKTQVVQYIKQLIGTYQDLSKKHQKSDDSLKQFKQASESLRKQNEELNKKAADMQAKQLSKTDGIEFKYQKYNALQTNVQALLLKEMPNMCDLWKEFIIHVKSRDKKIKDLESSMRKKDKQIDQKTKIQQMMRGSLQETEKIYLENKKKLSSTQQFIKKTEVELIRASQQYLNVQNQCEQDKSLLTLRLKAETEARNKLQQKMSIISKIQAQFTQVKNNQTMIQKDYEVWLSKSRQELDECKRDSLEKDIIIKNLTEESTEKERLLQKLQTQKQSSMSEIRQLKNKVQTLNATTENDILKIQLEQYKSKIMCSCTGERQREVVLKTCPHLFCKRCIEQTTYSRNRKCPLCGIKFTKTDIHEIKWS